jgi:hypothetical protein
MSDSVGYLPSSDPNAVPVAVDDIAGKKFQRVKMVIGAAGQNDGDVAASNPLPVISYRTEQLLGTLVAMAMSPTGFDRSLNRLRVTASLETGFTTIGNIATLNALGALPAQQLAAHQNLSAWQACCRARIT